MKLAAILFKSGLAVAGAGIYLFFRRLVKKAKNTEKEIEKKVNPKTSAIKKQLQKSQLQKPVRKN